MPIVEHPEQLIGRTPLVRVINMGVRDNVTVAIKCEWVNPGGSIKDRTALAMIDAAEQSGELQPGGTIVEPTSGNTGVGLAMIAAQRGYRCVLVCTDKVAPDKVRLMQAHGAQVVVCPVAVAPDDPRSYYETAKRLTREIPGAWSPNQYANDNNVAAHTTTTGPEIWADTDHAVTHVVATAGTGGTVTGLARFMATVNPAVRIIAVDAVGSVYSGGDGRPYLVEGPGEDFFPETYDPDAPDEVVAVSDADAFATALRYAETNGILIGGSGGSALYAALQCAQTAPPGSVIVAVVPDSGRAYLSRLYDPSWMGAHGFGQTDGATMTVADVVRRRDPSTPELVWLRPDDTAAAAVEQMRQFGLSRVVVLQAPPPAVPAEVGGVVTARAAWSAAPDTRLRDLAVSDVGLVGAHEPTSRLLEVLGLHPCALVTSDGRIRALVTADDLEAALLTSPPHDGD